MILICVSYSNVTVITPLFTEALKDAPADPKKVTVVPSALYWTLVLLVFMDDVSPFLPVYLKRHTAVAAPPEKGILKVFFGIGGILIPPQFTGLYHVTPPLATSIAWIADTNPDG